MNKQSAQHKARQAEIKRICSTMEPICPVCHEWVRTPDRIHFLPKSIFGQYYTEPKNLGLAHRVCHSRFDDDLSFRQQQTQIIEQCRTFATEQEIYRYFGV